MKTDTSKRDFFEQLDNSLLQYWDDSPEGQDDTLLDDTDELEAVIDEFSHNTPRYSNGEVINKGASKKIIKAFDTFAHRTVALAMLKDATPSTTAINHFIREARITASLQHPNIISVHDIGFDSENNVYFSMDYIEGRTLSEILQALGEGDNNTQRSFSQNKLVGIFLNICNAMKYSHSKNIVHLDLKPSNILIGGEENPYICDWGIAETIDSPLEYNDIYNPVTKESRIAPRETAGKIKIPVLKKDNKNTISVKNETQVGHVVGTPGYMAPEQASNESKQRGKRTDIYALGAILYSILTYQPSLVGTNLDELVHKTLDGDIVSPKERAPKNKIPAALETISKKAMSTDVKNRYQSISELISDVRLFLFCGPNEKRNSDLFKKVREAVNSKRDLKRAAGKDISTDSC